MTQSTVVIGANVADFPGILEDSTAVVEIFVDGENGDDRNSGLAADDALQTIQQVYRRFPTQVLQGAQIIVNLAGIGGFAANATAQQTYTLDNILLGGAAAFENDFLYRGPNMVSAAPLITGSANPTINGANPTDQADQDGTPSGTGESTRVNFSPSPGWVVNELADTAQAFMLVRESNGDKKFFELPIAANGADFLVINDVDLDGLIVADDVVTIVVPGAKLEGTPAAFGVVIAVGNSSPSGGLVGAATFERIEFDAIQGNGTGISFDRCSQSGAQALSLRSGNVVNCKLRSLVLAFTSFRILSRDDPNDPVSNTIPTVGASISGSATSQLLAGSTLSAFGFNTTLGAAVFSLNMSVYRGLGIVCNGSILAFGDLTAVQGSGNSDVGLTALSGGTIQVSPTADLVTIVGANGAMRVDTGAPVNYGTGVGEFREVAGYNGNFTRALEGSAAAPAGLSSYVTTLLDVIG